MVTATGPDRRSGEAKPTPTSETLVEYVMANGGDACLDGPDHDVIRRHPQFVEVRGLGHGMHPARIGRLLGIVIVTSTFDPRSYVLRSENVQAIENAAAAIGRFDTAIESDDQVPVADCTLADIWTYLEARGLPRAFGAATADETER